LTNLRAVDANDLPWAPHRSYPGVYVRAVQGSEVCADLEVKWVRIAPGAEIPPHTHADSAETFYIFAGQGAFYMADRLVPCHAGSCGFAPPGAVHGLKNVSQEDLHLLAVFTPPLNK